MKRKIELIASYWTVAGDCYALGPNEVSPIPLRERVEAVAEAGYTGMGFAIQDLIATRNAIGYTAMKRLLNDHGIVHIEVEFLGNWFETGDKKKASDAIRRDLIEAAHELGARNMKAAGEMWTETCDVPRYAEAFAEVCADAAKIGIDVAIEILPMTNIRTLETGAGIVEQAGHANGGLCIDIWHMTRGGIGFDKVAKLPASYFKSVEIDDARKEMIGTIWEDTLFQRLYPGEGVFDCPGFITAVEQAGFRGVYGVEIINEKYRLLPVKEQARRSFDGTMAQFRKAGMID
jgi:sugar phosphate isomerase/epimerase